MKAVRPFFARAAKKCKYSYEGEVHQTSARKQFGRKSTEINDAMEAMSSASLVDMQVPEVSSAGNLNQHETPIKNNSANSTYCTSVYPSTTTIKPVQSSQDEEQNASSGSYQEYCSESMEPLQQPCFTSPDKLGRRWHNLRRKCYRPQRNQNFTFKVVSYNVLADGLLHSNSHLYCGSEEWLKDWEYRRKNLLKELLSYKADVLCLQEVEDSHYEDWFEPKLREKGYTGVYKKRSGDKTDGCATFFKKSRFTLVKSELVSFNKPNVKLMDRHNVAVVVLLKPKVPGRSSRNSNNLVCISNTHLLFNKKRGDIKLAQLACLFSEIEEIARISSSGQRNAAYHPIICCGDFNSIPFSPIYDFVMRGSLNYKGMHRDNFSGQSHMRRSYPPSQELRSNIIPWELGITTTCTKRNESTEVESVLSIDCEKVDLQPSGVEPLSTGSASCVSASKSVLPFEKSRQHFSLSRQAGNCAHLPRNHHLGSLCFNPEPGSSTKLQSDVRGRISLQNTQPSSLNSTENENVSQEEAQSSTHLLAKMTEKSVYDATTIQRHNFSDVFSVYRHYFQDGQPEVTTFHDQVCTIVDYIFVSPGRRQNCQRCHRRHGSLQMTGNLELLSESDIQTLGGLPNKYISSDHLALVSSFLLHV